ncbi:MAG: nicotinate-nucleotide adenylyltransferase [Candidatus Margulisbacteria bacterium]|nr:nicotinate-nucleotide adenylyltransferase [Candidatus Margulisiibacteriota bacterium]MBU1021825.1 nicotinate-nucleotide adenylyltransferase [Candidatus Margulisiibacteriota bacterium]MBU1728984.1 nicotinate-nucleotide adenylyltransferase [Candidatus Margulisiibacteriota bacterium]MBU1954463.1 nicotinate-nucleotide adenylyltransferase [Candidatus Margulisiibacteriota bacterium]
MREKKIGIMGGTFNPVHFGHLEIAKKAKQIFNLEEVLFIPSGTPPHKTEEVAPKNARYQMVLKAISRFKDFHCSRIELDRKGYSYAVDTFSGLHQMYGQNTKLFYIMGMDSINELFSWKKPLELFNFCEIIVFTRPKAKRRIFNRLIKFPPLKKNKDKIHVVESKINIASSDIRTAIKKGDPIDKEVPKIVIKYIGKRKLYFKKSPRQSKKKRK